MATLYVTEGGRVADGVPVTLNFLQLPEIANQALAIGAGSVQSAPFNVSTRMIQVHTDAICSISVGVNPTAVATKMRMAAGETRVYIVRPGHQIAVITNV